MSDSEELVDSAPVLLVDDTAANLLALQAVLSPLGVATVAVRSGEEALAHVERRAFAVALVDVQMPEMDGFELTARLRELELGVNCRWSSLPRFTATKSSCGAATRAAPPTT
ncbi:MAG: response regulator [Polyangiaceae bacterium]